MNAIEILRELAARKQRETSLALAIAKHFDITTDPKDKLRRDAVHSVLAGELEIDVWWRSRREMTQALLRAGAKRGSHGGASLFRCIRVKPDAGARKEKAPATQ